MSATNSTTHYELPSFLGSDKPAWLVDWNGAMATIDSAIYEAKQAADSAGTSASAVASDLATLSGTVSSQGSTISTLSDTLTTAVGNINTINGNITTINSLIGNGTPTTTDQTIIGAINEINAHVGDIDDDIIYKDADITVSAGTSFADRLNAVFSQIDMSKVTLKTKLTANDGAEVYNIVAINSNNLMFTSSYTNGGSITSYVIRLQTASKFLAATISDNVSPSITNYTDQACTYTYKLYY